MGSVLLIAQAMTGFFFSSFSCRINSPTLLRLTPVISDISSFPYFPALIIRKAVASKRDHTTRNRDAYLLESVGIVHTLRLQEQVKSKLKHPPENVENTGLLPSFRRKMIELSKLKVSWGAVHRFTERFLPRPGLEDIVICKW